MDFELSIDVDEPTSNLNEFAGELHVNEEISQLNIDNCAPEEEIDNFIESNTISVSFFLESAVVEHNNYTHLYHNY